MMAIQPINASLAAIHEAGHLVSYLDEMTKAQFWDIAVQSFTLLSVTYSEPKFEAVAEYYGSHDKAIDFYLSLHLSGLSAEYLAMREFLGYDAADSQIRGQLRIYEDSKDNDVLRSLDIAPLNQCADHIQGLMTRQRELWPAIAFAAEQLFKHGEIRGEKLDALVDKAIRIMKDAK